MTSQTEPKTVELYGYGEQHEATASGAILPGSLVERSGSGVVKAHGTAGGPANLHFANEYGMTGGTIRDEYADGDNVIFTTYYPGAGIYATVAQGAAAISAGDNLASAGDGTLAAAGNDEVVVAQALDDVDNSSGDGIARLRVEVVSAQRSAGA